MTDEHDLEAIARAIIDANLYMVLGTVDQAGRPWVTPVYYASTDYRAFFWVSEPDAKHSRNLEARGAVSIVIFDSTVPINTGQAVYMSGTAQELTGEDRTPGIDIYSRRALSHGGRAWTLEDVQPPAHHRLSRAVAVDCYVLDEHDNRVHPRRHTARLQRSRSRGKPLDFRHSKAEAVAARGRGWPLAQWRQRAAALLSELATTG